MDFLLPSHYSFGDVTPQWYLVRLSPDQVNYWIFMSRLSRRTTTMLSSMNFFVGKCLTISAEKFKYILQVLALYRKPIYFFLFFHNLYSQKYRLWTGLCTYFIKNVIWWKKKKYYIVFGIMLGLEVCTWIFLQ